MTRIVYLDVLIAVNLFINYFLLLAVSKFLYLKINRFRIIVGAFVGALFSIYILFPEGGFLLSSFIKFLISFVIVSITFGFKDKIRLLKSCLYFYLVTFIFLGIGFGLGVLTRFGSIFVRNSFVYFNISPIILVISTVLSYAILEFINKFIGKGSKKTDFCRISIRLSKNLISFDAKLDTGLNLKEPFSNLPVIIANKSLLSSIFPKNLDIENYESMKEYGFNIRLIPFNTIVGSGLLVAFKPEKIIVNTENGIIVKEGYVAICSDERLNGHAALVGFDIVCL